MRSSKTFHDPSGTSPFSPRIEHRELMPHVVEEHDVFLSIPRDVGRGDAMNGRFLDAAGPTDAAVEAVFQHQLPRAPFAQPDDALLIDEHQSQHRIEEQLAAAGGLDAVLHAQDASIVRLHMMHESAPLLQGPGRAVGQRHKAGDPLSVGQHDLIGGLHIVVEPLQHAVGQPAQPRPAAIVVDAELGQIDFDEICRLARRNLARIVDRDKLERVRERRLHQEPLAAEPDDVFGLSSLAR